MQAPKPKLNARDVMLDICAGLRDEDLMSKYRLSAKGLTSLFNKLIAANLLSPEQLEARQAHKETTVDIEVSGGLLSGQPGTCHLLMSLDVSHQRVGRLLSGVLERFTFLW